MVSMFMLLFAYIGGASYVYQDNYGVSSEAFGLLFASTGIALMAGAFGANRLARRIQQHTLAIAGVVLSGVGSALAVLVTIADAPIGVLVGSIAVIMLGLGFAEPALMSNTLSSVEKNTGQAAALLGAGQFVLGAGASGIAGLVVAFGPVAWAGLLLAISLVALLLCAASAQQARR